MAGFFQVLLFEFCFRQALVEVVISKMFVVIAIMATVKGPPPDEWKFAMVVLCLSVVRAALFLALGGRCRSPDSGGLASRRTTIMYIQGSILSFSICSGYAYLLLDLFGYAADPPDRPPFSAMTLTCVVPSLFLSFHWVFSCFGPAEVQRREAIAREKSLERIPVSLSQVETFELCPDSPGTWDSPCVICMDDFSEGCEVGRLPCAHAFHDACIREWLSSRDRCPMRCTVDHCGPGPGPALVLGNSAVLYRYGSTF